MSLLRRLGQVTMVLAAVAIVSPAARASDSKILPGSTEWVVTVNLKQILESPLAKAHKDVVTALKDKLSEKLKDAGAAKFLNDVGLDLFRDVHSVTVAGTAKLPELVVIEGNFDTDKLVSAAEDYSKQKGDVLKVTKAGKLKIFEITPPNEPAFFSCVVNKNMVLGSDTRERLDEAIARVEGSKQSTLKKEFKSLIESTNDKQSFSFVATAAAIGKFADAAPLANPNLGKALQQGMQDIGGLFVSVTATKDIQFQLGISAKDADTAKKLADGSAFGLTLIKNFAEQGAKKDEKLAPLVDIAKSLRVTNQGNKVVLSGEATVEAIERLMKNAPNFQLPGQLQ